MKNFDFFLPTEIIFGENTIDKLGEKVKELGDRCLLVTTPETAVFEQLYNNVKENLKESGVEVFHFEEVEPNPTTEIVNKGVELAKKNNIEVVLGLGGGSSMDVSKAIAVGATHEGEAWDYLHYKTPPTKNTLPIVAVSTTSGTGSQVTQAAVMTNSETDDKSAIWHPNVYPKVAIVDPTLVKTLPKEMTALTGFDAFTHNFEGYISVGANPITDMMALEGIKLIVDTLPKVLNDLGNLELRSKMALADTLGGIVITHAGVTLPHGLGMQISGHCPHVPHGASLAVTYPEFTRYTYESSIEKFATVGRIFNPNLIDESDEEAAKQCCKEIDKFLKDINLWINFKDLNVPFEKLTEISNDGQVLNDYKNNPRLASIEEMHKILVDSYDRE